MAPLTFAYYCSGHGYGHATRVSAVATYLRQMDESPTVHIVSSAPKHVFAQAVSSGALYRYAEIDPVIVQPLAYHVDRRKSVDVLKDFLSKETQKLEQEQTWLKENNVDCVLSDAAFLACKAANAAGIPSVLITNFTFDSVYSYLSIEFPVGPSSTSLLCPNTDLHNEAISLIDEPIPPKELLPLVNTLQDGYRCAELLIRLPGNIPIPSFHVQPAQPSYLWTDTVRNAFHADVSLSLSSDVISGNLHPSVPFPVNLNRQKALPRRVIQSPLIVRHPSEDAYSPEGRKRILDAVGVPVHLQARSTKILIVSFGGQVFRKPSSRTPSRSHSPTSSPARSASVSRTASADSASSSGSGSEYSTCGHYTDPAHRDLASHKEGFVHVVAPVASPSHLWVPGAPPASKMRTSPSQPSVAQVQTQSELVSEPLSIESGSGNSVTETTDESSPSTDTHTGLEFTHQLSDSELEPRFLPDSSWIAIVCGATNAAKGSAAATTAEDDELPTNFFIAPRDVYMPDLTAVGDVLLGKLGYGTTAECLDAATPFVFVPRPLFVEEHGLKRLLTQEGVGVELSCERYEAGDWATHVRIAWEAGRAMKEHKRKVGENGERRRQGEKMARELVEWVREWQYADAHAAERVEEREGKRVDGPTPPGKICSSDPLKSKRANVILDN
ncbi:hypothetical protein M0805_001742 [Coniferiporia weirii]|nr:hypothetical protein M0805_001742 [Coniferiporia weirii]